MMEELKITGPSYIGKNYCRSRVAGESARRWPTNHGPMTLQQLSKATGIKIITFYTRTRTKGFDCENLLAEPKSGRPASEIKIGDFTAIKLGKRRNIDSVPLGTWELEQLAIKSA